MNSKEDITYVFTASDGHWTGDCSMMLPLWSDEEILDGSDTLRSDMIRVADVRMSIDSYFLVSRKRRSMENPFYIWKYRRKTWRLLDNQEQENDNYIIDFY